MYSLKVRRAALTRLASGESMTSVSRRLGVSRATLRLWQIAGFEGRLPECPSCDGANLDAIAYAALLGFYLGDGNISKARGCHVLRVSCDAKYGGIIDDVGELMRRVRPHGRVFHVRAPGAIVVQSNWAHWPCLFRQNGDGPKHSRSLVLADWQSQIVEQQPAHFLRGLFHSDGCRATNVIRAPRTERSYSYARWMFSNRSADIHAMCQWALDVAGVEWTRAGWHTCVSRRDAVARLDGMIGLKA
jgi:hypothetical protein